MAESIPKKKLTFDVEMYSESGITRGVGYNIAFEPIKGDSMSTPNFTKWREQVAQILLRHRDNVFDPERCEENARQLAAEIIAISKARGYVVADDNDVPAIQVSGIDPQNSKKGKKLDISFSATDSAPTSIKTSDYESRGEGQNIGGDGLNAVRFNASKKIFPFMGRIITR